MIEFKVEQDDLDDGMFVVSLHIDGKFIKKICDCYEEEYANMIADQLEKAGNVQNSNMQKK